MLQDVNGWGSAPPAEFWHCPECGMRSAVADWPDGPSDGDTRTCPHCGYEYTAGTGPTAKYIEQGTSARLSQADEAGHVKREVWDEKGEVLLGIQDDATPRGDKCPVCAGGAA